MDALPATMDKLTALERAALDAIASEMPDGPAEALRAAFPEVSVMARENTSGGFFSDLRMDTSAIIHGESHLGNNVWIAVEGLDYGLGMILHLKDVSTAMLEGYAVGPEDTSTVPFETVTFAVTGRPGSLAVNGS